MIPLSIVYLNGHLEYECKLFIVYTDEDHGND